MTRYVVVNAYREPCHEPVHTPSRALFYLGAFRQLNPTRVYEIATVQA